MLCVPLAIVIFPDFPAGQETRFISFVEYKTPSMILYAVLAVSTEMAVRLEHSPKAPGPMYATLLGMVIPVRLSQPKKEFQSILDTLLGIEILVRPEQ